MNTSSKPIKEETAKESNEIKTSENVNVFNEFTKKPMYEFFKGIPPLSTVAFTAITATLYFLIRFMYYLFRVGYLEYFNIKSSYVDFSQSTILSIALSVACAIILLVFVCFLRSIWQRNHICGSVVTFLFLFMSIFIFISATTSISLSNFINNLKISFAFTFIIVVIHVFGVILFKILNFFTNRKYKKIKKNKNKEKNNSQIDNNSKSNNTKIDVIVVFAFIILMFMLYFLFFGYSIATSQKEFSIIVEEAKNSKMYAIITEHNDRYVCVEAQITENNGQWCIKLNKNKQKHISIADTEYVIFDFVKVE